MASIIQEVQPVLVIKVGGPRDPAMERDLDKLIGYTYIPRKGEELASFCMSNLESKLEAIINLDILLFDESTLFKVERGSYYE